MAGHCAPTPAAAAAADVWAAAAAPQFVAITADLLLLSQVLGGASPVLTSTWLALAHRKHGAQPVAMALGLPPTRAGTRG